MLGTAGFVKPGRRAVLVGVRVEPPGACRMARCRFGGLQAGLSGGIRAR